MGKDVRSGFLAPGLLVPVPSLAVVLTFWIVPALVGRALFAFSTLWLVAFPAAWWFVAERGSWSWCLATARGLGVGCVTGAIMAAAMLAAHFAFGQGWVDAVQVRAMAERSIATPARHRFAAGFWVLGNSPVEEVVWRWFVFRQWMRILGDSARGMRGAIVASAACFTVHHTLALAGQSAWPMVLVGSAAVFAAALVWSWLYLQCRAVWVPWVAHVLADLPIFVVGGLLLFPWCSGLVPVKDGSSQVHRAAKVRPADYPRGERPDSNACGRPARTRSDGRSRPRRAATAGVARG